MAALCEFSVAVILPPPPADKRQGSQETRGLAGDFDVGRGVVLVWD
jgi:hypothetical protein